MSKEPTSDFDPTAPLTEQASHWWVVLNTGPATAEDHRAFGEWVGRSPERIEAFLQTARLTKALKSKKLPWPHTPVKVLAQEVKAGAGIVHLRESSIPLHPMEREEPAKWEGGAGWIKRSALPFASAATVLVLISGVWMLLDRGQRYDTTVGEQRSVVLSDGSVVMLNTASSIAVKMSKKRRTVRLLSGEALFQVAHDAARPFDVSTSGTTVRAVGTAFNVDKRTERTIVTVVEGKVAVSSGEGGPKGWARKDTGEVPLSAGEQLVVTSREAEKTEHPNIPAATAWTQRKLIFEHRPLGEVADEFNRYNRQSVQIDSPSLRAQEVTGVFQANDPESFLDFISKIPGVKIERDSDSTRVSDSPDR